LLWTEAGVVVVAGEIPPVLNLGHQYSCLVFVAVLCSARVVCEAGCRPVPTRHQPQCPHPPPCPCPPPPLPPPAARPALARRPGPTRRPAHACRPGPTCRPVPARQPGGQGYWDGYYGTSTATRLLPGAKPSKLRTCVCCLTRDFINKMAAKHNDPTHAWHQLYQYVYGSGRGHYYSDIKRFDLSFSMWRPFPTAPLGSSPLGPSLPLREERPLARGRCGCDVGQRWGKAESEKRRRRGKESI
jgi:hypothetical protein